MSVIPFRQLKDRKAHSADSKLIPGLADALASSAALHAYSTPELPESNWKPMTLEISVMGSPFSYTVEITRETGGKWYMRTIGAYRKLLRRLGWKLILMGM